MHELRDIARSSGLRGWTRLRRNDLVAFLTRHNVSEDALSSIDYTLRRDMSVSELRAIARRRGLKGWSRLRKDELINFLASNTRRDEPRLIGRYHHGMTEKWFIPGDSFRDTRY